MQNEEKLFQSQKESLGLFTELHVNFQFDLLLEKASVKQQKLVTSLHKKMVPATFVPRKLLPPFLCPAPSQTLCNSGGSELVYGCCPLAKAVCCPDHTTCCPSGMECATKGMCASNRSVMVRITVQGITLSSMS